MRVGISCSGMGDAATEEFVRWSAQAAEAAGFTTIWTGDHVALFGSYARSTYPYQGAFGDDVPLPDPTAAVIDPLIWMTWAAAHTRTIEVGSTIVILPQRQPVVLAKQLATLDSFCGGRAVFGAGVGWCREEYEAVGVPWSGRGQRTDEYLGALCALWRDSPASFKGETVSFIDTYSYPQPANKHIPILIGGESDAALRRVARFGDGWVAFDLKLEDAPRRIDLLRSLLAAEGRTIDGLRIIKTIFSSTTVDEMKRYRDAGVTEFSFVTAGELPFDRVGLTAGIGEFGRRFVDVAAAL